jgi:DNA-binding MarR family transcriptional regulator
MSHNTKTYLGCCLYFTANALSRVITKLAEEEFAKLRMSPSQAFLLMLVVEEPGITQKELSEHLHLAQSTVSRFADKLVQRGYVRKEISGKSAQVFPTEEGQRHIAETSRSWRGLADRYGAILGKEHAQELNRLIHDAHLKIEKSFLPD